VSKSTDPFDQKQLFDRALVRQRRARAARVNGSHFLIDRASIDICERICEINRDFPDMLDMSSVLGAISGPLIQLGKTKAAICAQIFGATPLSGEASLVIDEEVLCFAPKSFDLVSSALALHSANDLPGTLIQIQRILKPDGLFIGSFFAGETLSELRSAFGEAETKILGGVTPRVIPFVSVREAGQLLQRAGFTLPVADIDRFTVHYNHPLDLMHDLRMMGETNTLWQRSRTPVTRALITSVITSYITHHTGKDGRISATFDLVTVTGWHPHKSQQKPLKPGSAEISLTRIFNNNEFSSD